LEGKEERPKFYVRERIAWEHHISELAAEGNDAFQQLYRMNSSVFLKLCFIIRPQVQVNDEISRYRTGKYYVIVEMVLHCLLRWIAGGSYLDLKLSTGISQAAIHHYIYKFMHAILDSELLVYKFAEIEKELNEAKGRVGCLDSFLLQLKVQCQGVFLWELSEIWNKHSAACDHQCRFVYAALAAPGGANDIAAYRKTQFSQMVQNLPIHQPLQTYLKNVVKIFMCITRLQIFCINEGNEGNVSIKNIEDNKGGGSKSMPLPVNESGIPGSSVLRDIIVYDLVQHILER